MGSEVRIFANAIMAPHCQSALESARTRAENGTENWRKIAGKISRAKANDKRSRGKDHVRLLLLHSFNISATGWRCCFQQWKMDEYVVGEKRKRSDEWPPAFHPWEVDRSSHGLCGWTAWLHREWEEAGGRIVLHLDGLFTKIHKELGRIL